MYVAMLGGTYMLEYAIKNQNEPDFSRERTCVSLSQFSHSFLGPVGHFDLTICYTSYLIASRCGHCCPLQETNSNMP